MTRSIRASRRWLCCSVGVVGNADWSGDASNKCSSDAISSSQGRGNTFSYCDAQIFKLGTTLLFPCKLFQVRGDACFGPQNVLLAYLLQQELLENGVSPEDVWAILFLGLEEAPGVKNGLENWDWLVIVIPPPVPWKASMVICTTCWTVYRADSMCWGNRSQSVLTIDLSIHSNLVEDSDERRVFNNISATCLSKLQIHGLPPTCSLSSIPLLPLQMVYCSETLGSQSRFLTSWLRSVHTASTT